MLEELGANIPNSVTDEPAMPPGTAGLTGETRLTVNGVSRRMAHEVRKPFP